MEFQKGPTPVSPEYRAGVANTLKVSRVTASGLFDATGSFDVVRLGEKTDIYNTTPMWALNLLKFTYGEDGVRTRRDGFLFVYHERMTRGRREKIEPIHIIDPGNVRYVDDRQSFRCRVGESGWALSENGAWRNLILDNPISNEQLEEILVDAEAGKEPPFFEDHAEFVKVESGLAGRRVHVIFFAGIHDSVVVDIENKRLVGRQALPLLSSKRWENLKP